MPSTAKKIRYWFEWAGLKSASMAIPVLPRRATLALANGLGRLGRAVDKRGRETAEANLRAAFGDAATPERVRRWTAACYRSWARSFVDLFWAKRLTADNYRRYMDFEIEDPDSLERVRGSGAVFVCPHYGNYEWQSLAVGFMGFQYWAIAQDFKNPRLTSIFTAAREISRHRIIPQRRAAIRLIKHLRSGGYTGLLTDLNVKPDDTATIIRCFGLQTCVTPLHAVLFQRGKVPLIPGICLPRENGGYRMLIYPPLDIPHDSDLQEICQACWDRFEPVIREHPEHWLWMYKHWRYRPEKDGDRYPAYANRSKKFDRLANRLA